MSQPLTMINWVAQNPEDHFKVSVATADIVDDVNRILYHVAFVATFRGLSLRVLGREDLTCPEKPK